jgi:membrane associated rhomboid family serine protease
MPAILYAILFVVYSIYMDRRGGDNVNHGAHLWGAAYGVLFTIILRPDVISHFLNVISQPGAF